MRISYRLILYISICLAMISLACNFSDTLPSFSISTPAAPAATQTEPPVRAGPPPDLSTRLQIWLGPQPPGSAIGPADYFDLFTANALWQQAARGTHVFKLYGGWIDGQATDEQLRQIVADLQRRGLRIAFEAPSLAPTA